MDPLRPFSDLIRSLWKSSARRLDRATHSAAPRQIGAGQPADLPPESDAELVALRSDIRARLDRIGLADPRRAREAFVEAVMAKELGLGSTHGPELSQVAERVAAQIGSHPRLSARLHVVLTALAQGRAPD